MPAAKYLDSEWLCSPIEHLLVVFPDAICQVVIVEEQCAGLVIAIEAVASQLPICNSHGSQLLDLGRALLWVQPLKLGDLCLIALKAQLILIVHIVINALGAEWHRILLLILVHNLKVNIIVHLESTHLNLILPDLVMQLNIVENGVDEALDVRILVTEQLEHNLHHLGLMQYDFASSLEE